MSKDEKKEVQAASATPNDINSEILKSLQALNGRIDTLEKANKNTNLVSSQDQRIPQDEIKYYGNSTKIVEVEEVRENTKTVGEQTEEARQLLLKDRNDFLANQLYGDKLTTSYHYKNNSRHYLETAIINIYEESDSTFRELIGSKVEMLKKADYRGLLNDILMETEGMEKVKKAMGIKTGLSQTAIDFQMLARQLIHNRRQIIG